MKRFYKTASSAPRDGAFAILLDGRPVKTPMGASLTLPTAALAEAIAAEWAGQGEEIDLRAMPLTGLANTALDHVRPDSAVIARLETYAGHDLTCYRSGEPAELARREAAAWDPPLLWARTHYGLDLATTVGVGSVEQPAASLARLREHLSRRDEFALTGLVAAAGILKSVVLALSLADGKLSAAEAHAAAHVDEDFQAERWGWDAEAADRLKQLHAELDAAERFLTLARLP
ncbi:MAG: ATPase [Proteobacteria bacterium]|nr:ATPase [Pseudomonadota bacterium]